MLKKTHLTCMRYLRVYIHDFNLVVQGNYYCEFRNYATGIINQCMFRNTEIRKERNEDKQVQLRKLDTKIELRTMFLTL